MDLFAYLTDRTVKVSSPDEQIFRETLAGYAEDGGWHFVLRPGWVALIPLGFKTSIPAGWEGQIRPRSSAAKLGYDIPNSPATIDSDYRGEWFVPLRNTKNVPVTIRHGDAIAQLLYAPLATLPFQVVTSLDETERGEGGFGSTSS